MGALLEVLGSAGIEIDTNLKIFEIQEYLSSLKGNISADAIATGRKSLSAFTTGELREIADNSSLDQWATWPGYFKALVDEFLSRD